MKSSLLHNYALGIRFCILYSAFSILFTSASFAETTANVITSGNGSASVEANTSGKPHLTVGYQNVINTFTITLPDARIDNIQENEENGEITIKANAGKSNFTQRVIASRNDDAIIILLEADAQPFTQKIKFSGAKKNNASARTTFTASGNNIEVHSAFPKPVTIGEQQYYGYESLVNIVTDNGKENVQAEEITLTKCSQAMLVISSKPMVTLANPLFEQLAQSNASILSIAKADKKKANCSAAYAELLQRHMEKYTAVCKSVSLTLNTGKDIDHDIANLYNNLYFKSIRSGESLSIETDNFTALPKLTNLQKSQIRSSFLFDRYLYTLDTEFLEKKVLPLMLTTYEELEKTLKQTDDFGFYVIDKDDPTFDVSVSIFFLRDLVTTCNILTESQPNLQQMVPRLQQILAQLPPYKIDVNEEFRRFLYGESANDHKYSDVQHLYGLFYRNDPIITRNYDIRESCKTTIKACMDYRAANNLKGIDQGFLQIALASAALGEGNTSYKLITEARSHWDKASGRELVPIIKKMLVQSYYSPESSRCYLNILPAIPDEWDRGELAGIQIRGGITMTELKWTNDGEVTATMHSKTDITLDIYIRGHFITSVKLTADEPYSLHAKKKD